MKILLVGSGGREHAMAEALRRSPQCSHLYVVPGSDAINEIAEPVDVPVSDLDGLARFAKDQNVGLTVVGPEVPLVKGLSDTFRAQGLTVFGPSKAAAALEGSKAFTKGLLRKYHIPTGDYRTFDQAAQALQWLEQQGKFPIVLKADGLAAGKGVIIADDLEAAKGAVDRIMVRQEFGPAGLRMVAEEFLEGEEASVLAFTDGQTIIPLEAAKDHKQAFDGDAGPNTGGMGAFCPSPLIQGELYSRIEQEVLIPAVHGLGREGRPYEGILYAGLMISEAGPKVLEFNVRFGDPEAQVILPRLKTDLVEIFLATAEHRLEGVGPLEWDSDVALTVVLASEGYPDAPKTGRVIEGLEKAAQVDGVRIYHAGTRREQGEWFTSGGRVLSVTALAPTLAEARTRAYNAVDRIRFPGMHCRRDIGVARSAS